LNRVELLAHLQPEETRHPTDQQAADIIVLPIAAQLKRAGLGQRLIIEGQHHATPDATLIRLLAKAFALHDQLFGGNRVTMRRTKHNRFLCDPLAALDVPRARHCPRDP
jgi:hypothetical protein